MGGGSASRPQRPVPEPWDDPKTWFSPLRKSRQAAVLASGPKPRAFTVAPGYRHAFLQVLAPGVAGTRPVPPRRPNL